MCLPADRLRTIFLAGLRFLTPTALYFQHELTYLTEEEMAAAVAAAPGAAGSGLRLGAVRGRKPAFEEDDVQRIREVLAEVCAELGTPHACPYAAADKTLG